MEEAAAAEEEAKQRMKGEEKLDSRKHNYLSRPSGEPRCNRTSPTCLRLESLDFAMRFH